MNQDENKSHKSDNVNVNVNDDDNDELSKEINDLKIDDHAKKHSCSYCLKEIDGALRCGNCRAALYCNKECQKNHWGVHKNTCIDSNIENSYDKLNLKAKNNLNQGIYKYIFTSS